MKDNNLFRCYKSYYDFHTKKSLLIADFVTHAIKFQLNDDFDYNNFKKSCESSINRYLPNLDIPTFNFLFDIALDISNLICDLDNLNIIIAEDVFNEKVQSYE